MWWKYLHREKTLMHYAMKSKFKDASSDRLHKIFQNISQEFSLKCAYILKPN